MRKNGVFRSCAGVSAVFCVIAASACDLSADETVVAVNGAHHAARDESGVLPDYGDPDVPRVFTNDLGWTITLSEGFVVTTAVRLETCAGEGVELEMPFGPFPEYWLARDKKVADFARGPLPAGQYCTLIIEYGRYLGETAAMASDSPFPVKNAARIEGATLSLIGYAEREDGAGGLISIPFAFRSADTVSVSLPLGTLGPEGKPWKVSGKEINRPNLTVSKTYDQFFAGLDFEALDQAAVEAALPGVLRAQTGVIVGTSLY